MSRTREQQEQSPAMIWREAANKAADHEILTAAQERMLFRRMERGDTHARDEILRCNYRLVAKAAHGYVRDWFELPEAISAGHIGLIRAVEKFEWERGYKFSTYAVNWIKQAMGRACDEQWMTLRLPTHVAQELHAYYDGWRRLSGDGREPTDAEVAAETGMTVERTAELRALASRSFVSLDRPLGVDDPDGATIAQVTPGSADTAEEAGAMLEAELLDAALGSLTKVEREVIEALYLRGEALRAVAGERGLHEVEVRKIEYRARRKLRGVMGGGES